MVNKKTLGVNSSDLPCNVGHGWFKGEENMYKTLSEEVWFRYHSLKFWKLIFSNCSFSKIVIHIEIGVRYFPKGIFPRATSQGTISQVETSLISNFPRGNYPNGGRALRLVWARGPSTAVRTYLGSCCLGKRLWESTLHLGIIRIKHF